VAPLVLSREGLLEVYTRFADKSLWRLAQSGRFEDCDDVRLRNSAQFDAIRRQFSEPPRRTHLRR
jgi:hypothetical protein